MKNFLNKGIVLILITALILSLTSCGIPNYSPINCVSTSCSTVEYSSGYDYTKSYIAVTGDVVTDETLSAEVLSEQYPRICFFYTIAPSSATYLGRLKTAFESRYKTNTCLVSYSLASDRRFLETTVSSSDSTPIYLYQFTLDEHNEENTVSYVTGLNSFTRTSTSLISYVNFSLNSDTKNLELYISNSSATGGDATPTKLNRFNQKAFTTDTSLDGEAFSGNEVPAAYADQALSLYIYYSIEVGFSSYNNYQHTNLTLFKTISLQ